VIAAPRGFVELQQQAVREVGVEAADDVAAVGDERVVRPSRDPMMRPTIVLPVPCVPRSTSDVPSFSVGLDHRGEPSHHPAEERVVAVAHVLGDVIEEPLAAAGLPLALGSTA
jgi:hypothetical protein